MSRPAVSQHLRVLTDAGLVDVRPDGNRRFYRWRPEGLRDAASFLEEMWADRLADLKAAVEREEWPERTRAPAAARGGRRTRRIEADRRGPARPAEPPSAADRRRGVRVTKPESTTATATIEQTLRIQARPETVWRYWTDPERMSRWWGAAAQLDPRPGGICRVERSDGPVMSGEFLELVPYGRIVFSFGWEPVDGCRRSRRGRRPSR